MSKKTIKEQLIFDAGTGEDAKTYIKDVAEHGCIGGNCRNLVSYQETERFYFDHAEEIDELLAEIEDEQGEPYDITGNMKRLGQSNLRNFLAWFAYEVVAQRIMRELEEQQ